MIVGVPQRKNDDAKVDGESLEGEVVVMDRDQREKQ